MNSSLCFAPHIPISRRFETAEPRRVNAVVLQGAGQQHHLRLTSSFAVTGGVDELRQPVPRGFLCRREGNSPRDLRVDRDYAGGAFCGGGGGGRDLFKE